MNKEKESDYDVRSLGRDSNRLPPKYEAEAVYTILRHCFDVSWGINFADFEI